MAAVCGCAKPVCLTACLCGSLSPRAVTMCECVRGGDYYRVCRSVSIPKRLTHIMPLVHTRTVLHTVLHTILHIGGWEVPSVPGTQSPTTAEHTHSLTCILCFFYYCSVWTSSVVHAVYLNACVAGMTGIFWLVLMGELLNIYIWSVRTEPSLSPISLITHNVPTTHIHINR